MVNGTLAQKFSNELLVLYQEFIIIIQEYYKLLIVSISVYYTYP